MSFSDDYTGINEYGVLFFHQIRLWKESFINTDFLSRVNINKTSNFPNLLHLWNAEYRNQLDVYDNPYLNDILYPSNEMKTHLILDYSKEYLGFNYILEEPKITLSEDYKYYDELNNKSIPFIDFGKITADLEFNVPNSYSGSYTMSFWIFLDDATSITSGIHFTWNNHLQITLYNNGVLTAICFPQEYYSSKYDNTNIDIKYNNVRNEGHSAEQFSSLIDSSESSSRNWIYVTCAVSNYAEEFVIYGNSISETFELKKETLFKSLLNSETYYSLYPMRYFFSHSSNFLTTFKVENLKNSAKIYLRVIQLFRDFIPKNYNIKYQDLYKITNTKMPSLLFVANFAEAKVELNLKRVTIYYQIFKQKSASERTYENTKSDIIRYLEGNQIPLSPNFIYLPLCDFTKTQKFNEQTKTCESINSCDLKTLNAEYCMNEDEAFVCLNNFYINPEEDKVTCLAKCGNQGENMRIPGTMEKKGICSISKRDNIQTSFTSTAILSNYETNFHCENGFVQIDYKCKDKNLITNSAFFYSRCYNLPNFYKEFSNSVLQKISSGYLLEFWINFDHSLFFCENKDKQYYFYSQPHSLYHDYSTNIYYYRIIGDTNDYQLSDIHSYEWNKIVIRTVLGSSSSVIVYVNYNLDTPSVQISGISKNMKLSYISFCTDSNNGNCKKDATETIYWGSAYYKNIRVWDLLNTDILFVQAFNNKYYEYDEVIILLL